MPEHQVLCFPHIRSVLSPISPDLLSAHPTLISIPVSHFSPSPSNFVRTLGPVPLVRDTDNASVPVGLADRNMRLWRIYVCSHTLSDRADSTGHLIPSADHMDLSIVFVQCLSFASSFPHPANP